MCWCRGGGGCVGAEVEDAKVKEKLCCICYM